MRWFKLRAVARTSKRREFCSLSDGPLDVDCASVPRYLERSAEATMSRQVEGCGACCDSVLATAPERDNVLICRKESAPSAPSLAATMQHELLPSRPGDCSREASWVDEEIGLTGGRVTKRVVRVGATVRRPIASHSKFVHELLRHLGAIEFPHSPRLLGIDAKGREVLSYAEGWVPSDLGRFSIPQIRAAARIVSRLHDATASSTVSGPHEAVCHGDLSPCNFVFRNGLPYCLIDFDSAFAGPRKIDVGYALWTWLNIGSPDIDPTETGTRVGHFCTEYGVAAPEDPIGAILDAQEWLVQRCGPDQFGRNVASWATDSDRWVRRNREALAAGATLGAARSR